MTEKNIILKNFSNSIAIFFLFAFSFTGCQKKQDPVPPRAEKPFIGISYLTSTNPFFVSISVHVEKMLEARGFRVEVLDAESDPDKQERQVIRFIKSKADAIVIVPCNSQRIGRCIRMANEASIPVFTCDVATVDPRAKVVSHIATDNYGGGKLAAHQILEAIDNEGEIAIIDYEGIESVQQRIRGFREVIAYANNEGANVHIVETLPASGSFEKSKQVMYRILDAHPKIKAVFAVNDPTAFGAVEALQDRGRLRQVKLVGFDGTAKAKELVHDGILYSDIIQFPEDIAKYCVDGISAYLEGENVPSQILIPTSAYKNETDLP